MWTQIKKLRSGVTAGLVIGLTSLASGAVSYTTIDIPSIDPAGSIYAQGINSKGDVTGYYETSKGQQFILVHIGFIATISGAGNTATASVKDLGYVNESQSQYDTFANPAADANYSGSQSFGFAINSNDTVVGSVTNTVLHVGLFTGGSPITDIGTVSPEASATGYSETFASAINDSGTVVGTGWQSSNTVRNHAFVRTPAGVYTDLSAGLGNTSAAYGITAAGTTVVGFQTTKTINNHSGVNQTTIGKQATYWSLTGSSWSPTVLPALPGGIQSVAYAVNSSGLIVGTSETGGAPDAVAWKNGVAIDLDGAGMSSAVSLLASPLEMGGFSFASTLNPNLGNVLNSNMGPNVGQLSVADAVNDSGQIVGEMRGFAFLATLDANNNPVVTNLNAYAPAGWIFQEATGINASGAIVGYGTFDGANASFELAPVSSVPEPIGLGVMSIAALGLLRRRCKATQA